MFRKEEAALAQWSEENIRLCAVRDAAILDNAAVTVRPGGRLVYATCTFAPEENECQIAAFLNRHDDFGLVDAGVTFGRPGLPWDAVAPFAADPTPPNADLTLCRRITPADGGEGHFIALLRRKGETLSPTPAEKRWEGWAMAHDLYRECFADEPRGRLEPVGEQVRLLPPGMPDTAGIRLIAAGIAVAEVCKNRLEPCHAAFMAAKAADCRQIVDLSPDDPRLTAFLRGEQIPAEDVRGWTAVAVAGITVGFGKASGGVVKNRYPKGLRLL